MFCYLVGERFKLSSCEKSVEKSRCAYGHTLQKLNGTLDRLIHEEQAISATWPRIQSLLDEQLGLVGDELEATTSVRMAAAISDYIFSKEVSKQRAEVAVRMKTIGQISRIREEIASCVYRIQGDIRQLGKKMEGLQEQSAEGLLDILSSKAVVMAVNRQISRVSVGRSDVERMTVWPSQVENDDLEGGKD